MALVRTPLNQADGNPLTYYFTATDGAFATVKVVNSTAVKTTLPAGSPGVLALTVPGDGALYLTQANAKDLQAVINQFVSNGYIT